jgi:hypothetical protein
MRARAEADADAAPPLTSVAALAMGGAGVTPVRRVRTATISVQ